ncbi:MAG: M23 family metallopeptidase, partial [Clostridia bacterium]|nr:M23 family metallopeptidase [Clostridia bacterium]
MENNKKDYLIKTLFLQFLICIAIFLFIYYINYFNAPFFNNLKKSLNEELNKDFSREEIEETLKKIDKFSDENIILNNYSDEEFSAEISGEGGEDEDVNNSSVSYSEYKINYKIFRPVIGGIVSSEFGKRVHPISGNEGIHKGIDIAIAEGSPIYASFDGEVIEATYDKWNGNYIKIKHDNNIITVYCHCSKLFVEKGNIVRGGEVIAAVGSTGQSTGPHIHFEIRINDISYNTEYAL